MHKITPLSHFLKTIKKTSLSSPFHHRHHHHLPFFNSSLSLVYQREKMTELCLSSTPKKTATQFSTLLLSDLVLFFSFILSHPLYFAYFIFFSPYLLKLLSFLSPLFITTALLLLGFLTLSPVEVSESQAGFLLSTYYTVRERLWSATENEDREFPLFEEFEASLQNYI